MKSPLAPLALALSLLFGHSPIAADDAKPVPNLKGTWSGPFKVIRETGIGEGTFTLNITEQDGPMLKGEKSWETPGTEGNVAGKDVEKATEPLLGVVDFDGKTLYLAEQGDDGIHIGHLIRPDTLEFLYIEAGHATAFRAELTRQ